MKAYRVQNKTFSPLRQEKLVLPFPQLLEVAGELVPDGEECFGGDFLLSGLRLDGEKHTQLQETENIDKKKNMTSRPKYCENMKEECMRTVEL